CCADPQSSAQNRGAAPWYRARRLARAESSSAKLSGAGLQAPGHPVEREIPIQNRQLENRAGNAASAIGQALQAARQEMPVPRRQLRRGFVIVPTLHEPPVHL